MNVLKKFLSQRGDDEPANRD